MSLAEKLFLMGAMGAWLISLWVRLMALVSWTRLLATTLVARLLARLATSSLSAALVLRQRRASSSVHWSMEGPAQEREEFHDQQLGQYERDEP